jgi:HAD superfamily hydrolase (TIGR01549 family)
MEFNTVIFDMDGLLIDSEPWWQEAGMETLREYDIELTLEQYHLTTGLRTKEWIDYWFSHFGISKTNALDAENAIVALAIEKIQAHAKPMPCIEYIFSFFAERHFRIGLATSSPLELVDTVVRLLGIAHWLQAVSSAGTLAYSKPHPQVYINCAELLGSSPLQCCCFEDSFNGLIAAKAARMKCIIIPSPDQFHLPKWGAADLKLSSLLEFDESMLTVLR